MVVGILTEYPGATREQYDRLGQAMGLTGLPSGALFHLCGPIDGGWRIIDIWESEEAYERFVAETILPAARAVAFPHPSKREVFTPHHAFPAAQSSRPVG
jgi:hypothetical protein